MLENSELPRPHTTVIGSASMTWGWAQRGRFSVAALLAFFTAPTVAAAATRVAALAPQLRPSANNELRDRFHEALTRGLTSPDLEVIPAGEVRMRLGMSE